MPVLGVCCAKNKVTQFHNCPNFVDDNSFHCEYCVPTSAFTKEEFKRLEAAGKTVYAEQEAARAKTPQLKTPLRNRIWNFMNKKLLLQR